MEDSAPKRSGTPVTALSVLGIQFGRHTGAYTVASGIVLLLSLVQVAVVTRFLDPSEFGRLALLLFLAALLTISYNLGSLQGTFGRVYGSAGDDDGDEADDVGQADPGKKREALGTGLILTTLVGLLGTLALAPFASGTAELLVGDSADSELVLLALASGALGAIWRLVSNIPRLERRPRQYIWLNAARPVLVLAAVTALLASGSGIEAVLIGTVAGSLGAILVGLWAVRASWLPSFGLREAREIYRRGIYLIPIILSFWIVQNADLFALSRYVDDADVGIYRLAGRIASIASYAASAFFLAWIPLRRATVFKAAQQERGRELEGTLLTYFIVMCAGLLVGMTVGADLLVKIAPPEYSAAAPLVPLIGGAFVAHGVLVATYRSSSFSERRVTYVTVAVASVGIFIAGAMALIPPLGTYGAALAVICAFLPGAAWIAFRSQFGSKPIVISRRRLLATFAVAGICLLIARAGANLDGAAHTAVQTGALLAFGPLLVLTGAVPRRDLAALRRIASSLRKQPQLLDLEQQLPALDPRRCGELLASIRAEERLPRLAQGAGREPAELAADAIREIRRLSGADGDSPRDGAVGLHLLIPAIPAEYDAASRRLLQAGADAEDLGRLELAVSELRAIPDESWPQGARDARQALEQAAGAKAPEEDTSELLGSELKELARDRVKAMLGSEQSFGENVRYVIENEGAPAEHMIVGFASTRPGTPDRYSNVEMLTRSECPTLFVRCVEGRRGHGPDAPATQELIELQDQVRERLGVPKEKVISCGGSAGALRALYHALVMGYGHAVIGAPPVLTGDFLMNSKEGSAKAKIAARSYGEKWGEEGAAERINHLLLDPLAAPIAPLTIHLHLSEQDQLYPYCLPPIQAACEASDLLTLDLTLSDYERHARHRFSFRPYLQAKLDELLG